MRPVEAAALLLDDRAARVALGQGAVELALGETVLALFSGDRLLQLGYAARRDYAVERLGVPARTMFAWVELAKGLLERPLLRRAVVLGRVSPRKAREILAVAVGEAEARWTAAAMTCTLEELQRAMRSEGREPPECGFESESLELAMTAPQQDRLDAAIALARDDLGPAPRWQCVEAICQEWLGAHGEWVPVEGEASASAAPPPTAAALSRQLAAVEEARGVVGGEGGGGAGEGESARELQARVDRLLEARAGSDLVLGALAAELQRTRAWATLGYRSIEEYARERLGMSARTFRQRAWLERRLLALPELRAALESGRLTYSKALLVAKDPTPLDVAARISDAATTTWQQVDRESTAEEDRQSRARGVRRIWGPKDAAETIATAISCAQAWSEAVRTGARPAEVDEADAHALVETAFLGLRLDCGMRFSDLPPNVDPVEVARWRAAAEGLVAEGLLVATAGGFRLPRAERGRAGAPRGPGHSAAGHRPAKVGAVQRKDLRRGASPPRVLLPGGAGPEIGSVLPEPRRRAVCLALVDAQDRDMSVPRSRGAVAQRLGLSEAEVVRIEREGLDNDWPPLGDA